jgi:mannobiose 2-epimerase
MKKNLQIMVFLFLSAGIVDCQSNNYNKEQMKANLNELQKEVTDNLTSNILPYWSGRMVDRINGGFYGRSDWNDSIYPDAEKGGILNARILWTYSSAYRILNNKSYLELATRAKDYILDHFIDTEYGGAYRSVDAKGAMADGRKQIYTLSFFIYGLAEYSRATGDKQTLEEAMAIFNVIEKYAFSKGSNGYFEVYSRDWKRLNDRLIGETSGRDELTMNTHLHLLEAYANLYRVTHEKLVGERLKNLIGIFLDRIIDKTTNHLICFFDNKWNPTSEVESFGHDIECSWLLSEAAEILGDKDLISRVNETSLRITDAASEGQEPDGAMLTEKNKITGEVSKQRSWWEQAETVVGNLNAFELSGDTKYLKRSTDCWAFIKQYFVDYKNGGWYSYVTEDGKPGKNDKAGFWICPYHNSRMCLEVISRVKE